MSRSQPIAVRFAHRWTPEPNTGCWLWTEGYDKNGYGVFWLHKREREPGLNTKAHRVSWMLSTGAPPPKGAQVLHRCDTPACVNPDHMFLGTPAMNMADKAAKGRARGGSLKGCNNPKAKLHEADVIAIRAMEGSHAHVARQFGVTNVLIRLIRKRQIWRHVA